MPSVTITRPFIEGMNTDSPGYDVRPRQSVFAEDLMAPQGMARQRRGWSYDGTTADAFTAHVGVYRAKYILADVTQTLVSNTSGVIYIHNSSSSGTVLNNSSSTDYLPRAMYRDELLFCGNTGQAPLLRHSGMTYDVETGGTTLAYTSGQSIVTASAGSFAAGVVTGSYLQLTGVNPTPANDGIGPRIWSRVVERVSSTVLSMEGIRTVTGGTMNFAYDPTGLGLAYPAVSVYEAGTISTVGDYTVTGGHWTTGDWGSVTGNDCIYLPVAGTDNDYMMLQIASVDSNTSVSVEYQDNTISNQPYAIGRRLPFKDVAAHRDSLWGAGVAQHPNRVYVGPPGWNIAHAPGVPDPYDPATNHHSTNRADFFMQTIDVPTPFDGDVVVAILATSNPLLVLKRSGVYGIFGSYPNFTTEMIQEGAGCIDIKSAWSLPSGPFWAGENGIFTYRNGRVIDITSGRINREWRSLFGRKITEAGGGYVTIGEVYDHLFVSARNDDGLHYTYVFDMVNGTWISRFTNHKARNMFSSKVPGEKEKLLWVGPDFTGRVMDSANTVDTAITGNERDGDGTKPRMKAWTGTNLSQRDLNEDSKMLDLAVTANVYDGGTAGSTQLATSVVAGGGLRENPDETVVLDDIDSDTVDRVDRHYFRHVNVNGRYHQIRFDVDTFDTSDHANGAKVEIAEMSITFEGTADRT